jgi:hypothetical protein
VSFECQFIGEVPPPPGPYTLQLLFTLPPVLFTLTQVVLLLITSTFTFTQVQIQSNLGTTAEVDNTNCRGLDIIRKTNLNNRFIMYSKARKKAGPFCLRF